MRQGNSENDDQIEEKGKMGDDSVPNNSPKPSLTGRISNVQGRQTLQECPVKRERMTPFILGPSYTWTILRTAAVLCAPPVAGGRPHVKASLDQIDTVIPRR
jgi:hypothetical protein